MHLLKLPVQERCRKGFAVVADEIRGLSMGTPEFTSSRIIGALGSLEETSNKMTRSVTEILNLVQQTLEKLTKVNESVGKITSDSGNRLKWHPGSGFCHEGKWEASNETWWII